MKLDKIVGSGKGAIKGIAAMIKMLLDDGDAAKRAGNRIGKGYRYDTFRGYKSLDDFPADISIPANPANKYNTIGDYRKGDLIVGTDKGP